MSWSIESGVGRTLWQYRDSPNVIALLESTLSQFPDVFDAMDALATRVDVDTSVGEQLDGIGEIVGVPRPSSEQVDPADTFAFDDADAALGFSSVDSPGVGGRMVGIGGLIVGPMNDQDYRTLIRATIFRNSGLSTVDHIAGYGSFVLGADMFVTDGVGRVDVSVARPLSSFEVSLIRATLPLAAGVRLGYISASSTVTESGAGYDDGRLVGIVG